MPQRNSSRCRFHCDKSSLDSLSGHDCGIRFGGIGPKQRLLDKRFPSIEQRQTNTVICGPCRKNVNIKPT